MGNGLTLDKANQLAMEQGSFVSLEILRREYGLKPRVVNRIYAEFFRSLRTQVEEGQREVGHLHAVLARLEQTCRQGGHERPVDRISDSPLVIRFANDLRALEGWTISLFETYLSIYGSYIPQGVPDKLHELARASWELWHKRQVSQAPFLKDPALFEYTISL